MIRWLRHARRGMITKHQHCLLPSGCQACAPARGTVNGRGSWSHATSKSLSRDGKQTEQRGQGLTALPSAYQPQKYTSVSES
jgi:hypothetical protein